MNIKPIISFFLGVLFACNFGEAKELSNLEISKQVFRVGKQYAESISCVLEIDPNNLVALTPFTYDTTEHSIPEYVLIWIGDVGCYGGSHTSGYRIATINIRAANVATVDTLLSSPVIKFPISPKSIKKITRLSNNTLKIIAIDETENNVEIHLKRDTNGNWLVIKSENRN